MKNRILAWWIWLMPGLVLVVSLTVTYQFWRRAQLAAAAERQIEFNFRCREVNSNIAQRMLAYEEVLHGVAGLFAASPNVDRRRFQTYVDSLQVGEKYPGIQGIGFSKIVPAAEKAEHVAAIRREGFATYDVRPAGEREFYTAIIYLEPFDERNLRAFGYDMYSEPVRRQAMEQSRDTGSAVLSGKVILVQEYKGHVQSGFLMYLPIYRTGVRLDTVADRRAGIVGWAYMPFRIEDLMQGLFGERADDLRIEIHDGDTPSPASLMFVSSTASGADPEASLQTTSRLRIAEHDWTLEISSNPAFEKRQPQGYSGTIAVVGVGWSLLLALLLHVLLTGRRRAEKLVQQRTTELVVARDQAQAANRAKSAFLASMSHELRTPLTAILGFSELMTQDPAISGRARNSLNIILRSGEHLLALINDILEIAKIETGHAEIKCRNVDLGEMLRNVISMMQGRAKAKGLSLVLAPSPGLSLTVNTDPVKCRQILVNLLGNAIKFTDAGQVVVRLHAETTPAGQVLTVEIHDTGVGISQSDMDRIFHPFEQAGDRLPEGAGLGLAITRHYVQMLGGQISVESKPGKGSCFRFTIPVGEIDANGVQAPAPTFQPGDHGRRASDFRILIVEDQPDNRQLLHCFVEPLDFQVRDAANGLEAVNAFQEWHPHLILMDRRMPDLDGLEATRRIRNLPGGAETVIIAVSAHAFKEEQREMMEAGCNDFLVKPFMANDLLALLRKHLRLDLDQADKAPAPPGAPPEENR